VHASQGAFTRVEGNTTLYKLGVQAVSLEFPSAPGAAKEAAPVFQLFDFHHEGPSEFYFGKNHG